MIVTDDQIIKRYTSYLRLEKGLSENTVAGYLQDLNKLFRFSEELRKRFFDLTVSDLHTFLVELSSQAIAARSQARILSGIKSFYSYLLLEKMIESDPTETLEGPKLGLRLPDVLSVEEMVRLINSFNLSLPEGRRNKAILEVLYGCGLRVSELVNLRLSAIYPKEEFIMVEGKGSKQRLVPISKSALREIHNYMTDRNELDIKKGHEDILFLNRWGRKLTRVMIFYIIKECCEVCGIKKQISPHTFRHSFASHLLEGGANLRAIQQMLGHESITTTEIYVHLDKEYLRSEILNHHPRNKKSPQ